LTERVTALTRSREQLLNRLGPFLPPEAPAEGGCGVVGLASEQPVAGRHLVRALSQMRNRGNGKGGGVALAGLDPTQWGVSAEVLASHHVVGIAYLDPAVREETESRFLAANYAIAHTHVATTLPDHRVLPGIEVRPPDVVLYFVRPRPDVLVSFGRLHGLEDEETAAGELIAQVSFSLNAELYAGERGNRAFVLCHARDLLVFKMVGYAEDVIRYYKLDDVTARVWIGHHRYPTKGRVWHPGGAHPFIGLNEALVHNGDFANYQSICGYLAQRRIQPLFGTDTEVSALVYDLHRRTYRYPLEMVIESLAPTTERDFTLLPPERQAAYSAVQRTHIHGSPDGPWFFIIAESLGGRQRLIGVTDTSMLRPQVFAVQRGQTAIAFCASEKQVIDAVLESLSEADDRYWPRPDHTWVARGGSHSDGGAFCFELEPGPEHPTLVIRDKFGRSVEPHLPGDPKPGDADSEPCGLDWDGEWAPGPRGADILAALPGWKAGRALACLRAITATRPRRRRDALALLDHLGDRRTPTGPIRRSAWVAAVGDARRQLRDAITATPGSGFCVHARGRERPRPLSGDEQVLIDAVGFPVEGDDSLAREIVALVALGWRRVAILGCRGHRFIGCGLGPDSRGVRLDVHGSSGDYLGSGIDGATLVVHGDAQDQIAQIIRSGELVIHGDVGQAFGYGAKGGHLYVLGSAAGRPMINAVGGPRVVINGTCLDYLAESFMAGNPLDGGGFVILNGVRFTPAGELEVLPEPYPGGNLFSLASGGAIYVRDPHGKVGAEQLNGGELVGLSEADQALILPHLERNEALFGIPLRRLLTVDGRECLLGEVYRKIQPVKNRALTAEEAWVAHAG